LPENTVLAIEQEPLATYVEPCVHTLGSRIHLISVSHTVDHIERWIEGRDGTCRRIVVTGFHGIWKAHRNARLRALLNSAELWIPDGIAPIWIAYLRGHRNVERTPGAEIIREFFRRAKRKQYRSYFYGDTDSTLSKMQAVVARDYPGHVIAGSFSPPFRPLTPEEDKDIIDRINAARPDVLWVGLGMPKQDVWIYERLNRLKVPVAIGVGAAFAFVAGTVPRCPSWIGHMGFEWVYRFLKEPRKLWRRDLLDGPQFLFHAGLELIRKETQD
jgi:N-acetylglucosaminyldiphosphoundecaprenol N-acetyl-beta-D-mannosaminyltransferase